ncbi:hypothetical protein AB0I34_38785 [Kribbella sp. NPDC050281]|uniref:hypothetical protein n=1 Tax=Kribbella sp. NPDC050281 TaxID=3155515 RepID=UPI0033D77515
MDEAKDGWGVVAVLDTGRRASTLGHNYPYHTDWITGNLTEGSRHTLRVEMWKGDSFWASDYCTVTA